MIISPISDHTGARITELDLARPMSDEEVGQLILAWQQYKLLVFPDQVELSEKHQLDFCRHFGPIMPNTANTEIAVVSNVQSGFTHQGRLSWHMDLVFTPMPIEAICLYGMVLPEVNISTFFASNIHARKTLSYRLAEQVETLSVRNSFDMSVNQHVVRYQEPPLGDEWPHVNIPLVKNHPLTGEPGFTCCEMFSDPISGLSKVDSDELLAEIFSYLYSPENTIEVPWQKDQLIIWDNIALQHGRPETPVDEGERTLRRVTISEHNGYEYFSDIVVSHMPQFRGRV